jgi:HEAT repeat protein
MFIRILLTIASPLLAALPLNGEEPSEAQQFAAQAGKLGPSNSREQRLAALEWLLKRCSRPAALQVMPAVERCIRHDPDGKVRTKAVETLGMTAYQPRKKICPLAVLEALFDKDADVRNIAMGVSGMYKQFAPGALPLLFKAAAGKNPDLRGYALFLLSLADGKNPQVQKVIRAARDDKDFRVRHDAHLAWFRITGKLDDLLPYSLGVLAAFRSEPLDPKNSEAGKQERIHKNLIQIGILGHLWHLGEERTDEVAKSLVAHLDAKEPGVRRGAVMFIEFLVGAAMVKPQPNILPFLSPSRSAPPPDLSPLLPYLEKEKPGKAIDKKPPPPPELLVRIEQLGVEKKLRQMQERDPDPAVRRAAAAAVKRWEAYKAANKSKKSGGG